ncbi:hypothetical protein L0F63_007177, partial [Massospora cicadina]
LPPTGTEQALQSLLAFQVLVMALFAQAAEQGPGEGRGEHQPVAIQQVRCVLLHGITTAQ